jgi:hypothetical protein
VPVTFVNAKTTGLNAITFVVPGLIPPAIAGAVQVITVTDRLCWLPVQPVEFVSITETLPLVEPKVTEIELPVERLYYYYKYHQANQLRRSHPLVRSIQ